HPRAVSRPRRRRVNTALPLHEIDLLTLAEHRAFLQIDDTVLAEGRDASAGLRIEREQTIPRRYIQDALVIPAVCPVRDAAPGQLPRRRRRAFAFALRVRPAQLARYRIE